MCPRQGWQRNWICREAQRPENPVRCFPLGERWCRRHQRGRATVMISVNLAAGRKARNAGSFHGKELGGALRIGPKRTDAPIFRRLRRHLLPKEGGYGSSSCSTGGMRHKSKSHNADFILIARRATPQPSGRRPVKPSPSA